MPKLRDNDVRDEVAALNIGSKVRGLRKKRGFTLQEVSNLTGLSKPLLSQIENNFAAPPVATLIKISAALGVKIGHFFQDDSLNTRLVVIRKEDRYNVKRLSHHDRDEKTGYHYQSLAYPMVDKQMEPFIVEIDPLDENEIPFNNHRGEEFLFLLDGKMEFRSSGQSVILNEGDCIYFDSGIPHGLRGLEGPAKALVVVYMPK